MVPILAFFALATLSVQVPAQRPPNVILVMTDDQGYGDVGAHGNGKIRTPNIDALHNESVRWTNYHVDPTCSPTRSALMSGRYSTRTGVWHTIMGRSLMRGDETTIAEEFSANGYRTAMFGKWHLGDNAPCRPQDQGFEHVVWHRGGGVGQGPDHWGNDYFDDTYEVDGSLRRFDGYCTDVWFEQASEFVQREDARPFFVYLATNAPHGPYLVAEKWWRPFADAGVPEPMAHFYGMIENIDHNLGKLRKLLEESGLAENTILVFTTDNGTAAGIAANNRAKGAWRGFNAGMRGQKGSEYDGGHRVPFYAYWPKGGVSGGRDIDALSAHVDVLPTLVELCGLRSEPRLPRDGASFAAALRGDGPPPTGRTMFVHSQRVEHPKKWRKCSVMTDRWRLVNGEQLFDIGQDPGQRHDIAEDHADVVAALRGAYEDWWRSLEPEFPRYVRIHLGGAENPVRLMSHDWHTEDRPTPWHQNHVKNGFVGNGPWAVDVIEAGRYAITLWRWPAQLQRAMGCTHASIELGSLKLDRDVATDAIEVTFETELPAGPAMLWTTLRRKDGKEHGAYFASVRRLE
ncbi:MAG: arylsulfatase [Planctomycetes bacterium]|nr:arylsulfatase [Planctomycetota bacterium]